MNDSEKKDLVLDDIWDQINILNEKFLGIYNIYKRFYEEWSKREYQQEKIWNASNALYKAAREKSKATTALNQALKAISKKIGKKRKKK